MRVRDWRPRPLGTLPAAARARRSRLVTGTSIHWTLGAVAIAVTLALTVLPSYPQKIDCLPTGQDLPTIPVIAAPDNPSDKANSKLRGTILLSDQQQRIQFSGYCAPQYVRFFQASDAITPLPPGQVGIPMPGPTLRARVGNLVQLTFLNQVNPNHYGASIDEGDTTASCDRVSAGTGKKGYPDSFNEKFPNCFHGSSTANIHFHGTHTNPNSTGDNVFLQVRPSPFKGGQPVVTGKMVEPWFTKFYADCETNLNGNVLSQWPLKWGNLPDDYTGRQENLLTAYDNGTDPYSAPPRVPQKLWLKNKADIDAGRWPQYFVGAYPYCFRLPEYKEATWPPPGGGLNMGQAPGLHWYHAHKHGSTAINVLNGMTGAFVIEGQYDDELNDFYGTGWTRSQPVMVINQIGVTPNALGGSGVPGGGPSFAVNGRIQPRVTMKPNEVQLWRIVNTSSRSSVFLVGFQTSTGQPAAFAWKQLAQDGVQLADRNYRNSHNPQFFMASGNRVDILVRAPADKATYNAVVKSVIARTDVTKSDNPDITLLSVQVAGDPATGNQAEFKPKAPSPLPFLADISDAEVVGPPRTLTFNSGPQQSKAQHTINNKQFSESFIEPVTLGRVEEWKIENATNGDTGPGDIDHPFHIHINPFQIVEVFDPNEKVKTSTNETVLKYVLKGQPMKDPTVQCELDLDKKDTWRDCHNKPGRDRVWWDVFAIPSGKEFTQNDKTAVVPGFFRMRSRFVDYSGFYVLHCHILAHEDRGMMAIVSVSPTMAPPSHH